MNSATCVVLPYGVGDVQETFLWLLQRSGLQEDFCDPSRNLCDVEQLRQMAEECLNCTVVRILFSFPQQLLPPFFRCTYPLLKVGLFCGVQYVVVFGPAFRLREAFRTVHSTEIAQGQTRLDHQHWRPGPVCFAGWFAHSTLPEILSAPMLLDQADLDTHLLQGLFRPALLSPSHRYYGEDSVTKLLGRENPMDVYNETFLESLIVSVSVCWCMLDFCSCKCVSLFTPAMDF
mgnify:CR=1 FL=1